VMADASRFQCEIVNENNLDDSFVFNNDVLAMKKCSDIRSDEIVMFFLGKINFKNGYCWFREKVQSDIKWHEISVRFFISPAAGEECPDYTDNTYVVVSGLGSIEKSLHIFRVVHNSLSGAISDMEIAKNLFSIQPFYFRWFSSDIKNFYSALDSLSIDQGNGIIRSLRPNYNDKGICKFIVEVKIDGFTWDMESVIEEGELKVLGLYTVI